jgi:uncharacterized protein (TIGR03435 family)
MPDASDMELVRDFARTHSEAAFAELVRRHINLVYSVAWRYTGQAQDAEDVTQAVFIILANKAAGLRERTVLGGWLYETTRFTAARLLRTKTRRAVREQEAGMESTMNESGSEGVWRQLAPHLEEAMSRLGERDRTLLALRYYENKSGAEAAALLGIREQAAHKRTARALDRLRKFFSRRGIVLSAVAIAGAVSANSVQAAPSGLAVKISTGALAKGAAAGGSALTLAKGALKLMAWTKAQTAIAVGVGVLLATTATTVVIKQDEARNSWEVWPGDFKAFSATLDHASPQVRILPTKFSNRGSFDGDEGGKAMGFDVSIAEMAQLAWASPKEYSWDRARTIISPDVPQGHYDFIASLPDGSWLALQKEMERKFGVVGKRETRNEDILLLTVKNPNTPGLKPGKPDERIYSETLPDGEQSFVNYQMFDLAVSLQRYLDFPVADGTGLAGNYDFAVKWPRRDPAGLKQALLDQLGLELVPTNMPIEMLVVEKAK